jgi:CDP-diacylglycerol--glycerol-3-phosphate 3-phosphatidyltransferase
MMTWPNRITILRILLLAPFLILLLNAEERPEYRYWALGVFVVMGLCDLADGQVARRFRQETRLGRVLDPLADKLVLTVTLIVLTSARWLGAETPYHIPLWVTVTILSKDGIILLGVLILHFVTNKTELGRPSVLGKMATAATFVLVLSTLVSPDLARLRGPGVVPLGLFVLSVLAVASSGAACLDYIRRGSKMLAANGGGEKV